MYQLFGKDSKKQEIYIYTLTNKSGMTVRFLNLGATIHEIWVPNKEGQPVLVSTTYDNPCSYEREYTYFGAVVAPYANRIAKGIFEIDGQVYKTDTNMQGHSLHSGRNGLSKKVWDVKEQTEQKIVFTYDAKDLEQGFPGNIHYEVTYEVTDKNELSISYYALSDKKTTINMTNHTYFNLAGAFSGSVEGHELWMKASHYTPVNPAKGLPTGEIVPVDGTPFDFRVTKTIGRDIRADFDQVRYAQGYDHNLVIDKETEGVEKFATAYAKETGIQMEAWTDCLGVQFYAGNFIGGQKGPNGYRYVKHNGFCLETQFFPNAINEPNFVRPITEAGIPYESKTVYGFSCK